MTWIDNIENIKLTIITGDGSEFTPLWKTAKRSRSTNLSPWEFNDQSGTLVKRGKVSGLVVPFELYFQGADHLEVSEAFDKATFDTRPWKLIHPMFKNELLVHPNGFEIDNSDMNISVIRGEFWETIEDTFPDSSIDVQAEVLEAIEVTMKAIENNYADQLGTPLASSIATSRENINKTGALYEKAAKTAEDLENVKNKVADALNALDNIAQDATQFMNKVSTLARAPAKFYDSVQNRIRTIDESFQNMKLSINGLLSFQNKLFGESMGSAFTAAKAEASVVLTSEIADEQEIENNVIEDYESRTQVFEVVAIVNEGLDDLLDTLGTYQSVIDATPDSYTPSESTILNLKDANTKATGQLSQIAIQAKIERIYTLPEPMGIVKLYHRLHGNVGKDNIVAFVRNNNLVLAEWVQLPKGRTVTYFK